VCSSDLADFLIIDRDISAALPEEIAATKILEHWIGGHRVWTAD
jgi:predicted amidohydrolase YtcJ